MDFQEQLQYQTQLYADTLENIGKAYEIGQINDDEFDALKANAYLEYQERIGEISDVSEEDFELLEDEEEDEYELASYSDDADYAEFSVGNTFGAALLELGDAAGYEDLEEYAEDLAEATGNDYDDIIGLIEGETVPDDAFALGIADLFELDEDTSAELLIAGIEARGDDLADYIDDEDEEHEDDEYFGSEDDEDAADGEANYRLAEVENELAEFKYNSTIKDALDALMLEAADLVDAGYMPPSTFEILFSSFDLDNDRIAAFNSSCDMNQVDPATELYALEKIVDIFKRMPPTVDFGYMVQEEYQGANVEEEQELSDIAENYVRTHLR